MGIFFAQSNSNVVLSTELAVELRLLLKKETGSLSMATVQEWMERLVMGRQRQWTYSQSVDSAVSVPVHPQNVASAIRQTELFDTQSSSIGLYFSV